MPTFIKLCVIRMADIPMHKNCPNLSRESCAESRQPNMTTTAIRSMAAAAPTNPDSSATTEKMKSLYATLEGRYPSFACVPSANPFPTNQPDPTEMRLCRWFQLTPSPLGSTTSGAMNAKILLRW